MKPIASLFLCLFLIGCYSTKERQVQLSTVQLVKIDTLSQYYNGSSVIVYIWRDLKTDVRFWNWNLDGSELDYKVGDVVLVFVR